MFKHYSRYLLSYFPVFFVFLLGCIVTLIIAHQNWTSVIAGFLISFLLGVYAYVLVGRAIATHKIVAIKTRELMLANEKLTEEIQKRKNSEQLKDNFVSTVSHEIRTPLTLMKSAIYNLQAGVHGKLTSDQDQVIEKANRQINRLGKIIDDLLDMSRLESGKMRLSRRCLPVRPLFTEVVQTFEGAAKSRGIEIITEIAEDLPPIFADETMIMQVFMNLVSNALKHATKKIVLSARVLPATDMLQENGTEKYHGFRHVQIRVLDDGIGIPREHLPSLFNKFIQINRRAGSGYQGTGLGLAICKEIIFRHDGKIWVESDLGRGAAFFLELSQYDERDEFEMVFEQALMDARQRDTGVGLIAIGPLHPHEDQDIDFIKNTLAEKMTHEVLRKSDRLFRNYTPDHILILLEGNSIAVLDTIVERISQYLQANFKFNVVFFPRDGKDSDSLLKGLLK